MMRRERERRSLRLTSPESLERRALLTMAAVAPLPEVDVALGATAPTVELSNYFRDSNGATDYAVVNTSLGTIPVLLTPKTTPTTVANFLSNVSKGDYTNTIVDRSVPGSTWEAGAEQLGANANIKPIQGSSAVANEAGAPHVRGAIAMAPAPPGAAGAASPFVFTESNNPATGPATAKSTVFGHVVSPEGLAVMDAIAAVPVPAKSPLGGPLAQAPLQYYAPGQPLQAYNLTMVNSVTTASAVYTVESDNPGVATATVANGELKVTPETMGTAHLAVVAYGSDGQPVTNSFTVNVDGYPEEAAAPAPVAPVATPNAPIVALPVIPPSLLVPTASGSVPTAVVAGSRTRIAQEVALFNPAYAVSEVEQLTLSLAPTAGSTTRYNLTTTSTSVKLAAGKSVKLNVTARQIGAAVPAGTYHLLVTVTDAEGATTIDTGKTIAVAAPAKRSAR